MWQLSEHWHVTICTLVSFLKNSTVYTLLVLLTSYDNLIDKLSFVFNRKKEYNYVMIGEA